MMVGIEFQWENVLTKIVNGSSTPFYVFAAQPFNQIASNLPSNAGNIPIKHFFSFKTTPVSTIVLEWVKSGRSVEVVSEFEYRASIELGINPSLILANGPLKANWINIVKTGSWVHIDSEYEAKYIAENSSRLSGMRYGLRIAVDKMRDPDDVKYSAQFGIEKTKLKNVLSILRTKKIEPESIHFHLQSNVPIVEYYSETIEELSTLLQDVNWFPCYLDIGGGVPSKFEIPRAEIKTEWTINDLAENIGEVISKKMPWIREIWMENGRYVTESSGVFVAKVCDIKELDSCRYLICDGGRVNNALVSDWENRKITTIPERKGDLFRTSICGPTCMAWDWLDRGMYPNDIQIGDIIVWHNAGAYHIPFETKFSHPLSEMIWVTSEGQFHKLRNRQSFKDWFQQNGLLKENNF